MSAPGRACRRAFLVSLLLVLAACSVPAPLTPSETPTVPGPAPAPAPAPAPDPDPVPVPSPEPTPVAPPAVTPPQIAGVSLSTARTEVDRDVTITAVVEDMETSPDALTYIWTATDGELAGSGRSVLWRLRRGATTTPRDVTISVTVVEPYQVLEDGKIVDREYRVTRAAPPLRVHDSPAEITRMVRTFLIDYFGNIQVSPDACLVDFSDSCPGKADERRDIVRQREEYDAVFEVQVDVQRVDINAAGTFADIFAPCLFKSRKTNGTLEAVSGNCVLTAVYERGRWWLCDSFFRNGMAVPFSVLRPLAIPPGPSSPPEPGTFGYYVR